MAVVSPFWLHIVNIIPLNAQFIVSRMVELIYQGTNMAQTIKILGK